MLPGVSVGAGALFAGDVAGEAGVAAGFALLAVGLGVDVGVGVCEEVACPGALVAEAAAVACGAGVVVFAALAFVAGAFFAGVAAFVSSPAVAVLADLTARVFGAGFAALATVGALSEELVAAVLVDACLGFAAAARVDFGFFSTASLTASLTVLTCSLVAWAFFGRVVDTCRMLWYTVLAPLRGAMPVVNHPLPHLDKSCVLGPNLNILSISYVELWSERNDLSWCALAELESSLTAQSARRFSPRGGRRRICGGRRRPLEGLESSRRHCRAHGKQAREREPLYRTTA